MYYVKGRGTKFIYKRSTLSSRTTEGPSSVLHVSRVTETVHRMPCCRCQWTQEIGKCIPTLILAR